MGQEDIRISRNFARPKIHRGRVLEGGKAMLRCHRGTVDLDLSITRKIETHARIPQINYVAPLKVLCRFALILLYSSGSLGAVPYLRMLFLKVHIQQKVVISSYHNLVSMRLLGQPCNLRLDLREGTPSTEVTSVEKGVS